MEQWSVHCVDIEGSGRKPMIHFIKAQAVLWAGSCEGEVWGGQEGINAHFRKINIPRGDQNSLFAFKIFEYSQ